MIVWLGAAERDDVGDQPAVQRGNDVRAGEVQRPVGGEHDPGPGVDVAVQLDHRLGRWSSSAGSCSSKSSRPSGSHGVNVKLLPLRWKSLLGVTKVAP